jgi:hypothetical protein
MQEEQDKEKAYFRSRNMHQFNLKVKNSRDFDKCFNSAYL